MIQDHDPGDEDREVVPVLTVERALQLIEEGARSAREMHERTRRMHNLSPEQWAARCR